VPKQKTKKAVSKRMRTTKSGKVMRGHMMTRHMMSARSAKRRRNLRRKALVPGKFADNMRRLMGS